MEREDTHDSLIGRERRPAKEKRQGTETLVAVGEVRGKTREVGCANDVKQWGQLSMENKMGGGLEKRKFT